MEAGKLTKEGFWNALYAQYPEKVQVFCDWIDEYKKKNNWDYLFCNRYLKARNLSQTKYHDLPLAMQFGIFLEFTRDKSHSSDSFMIHDLRQYPSIRHFIQEWFDNY